MEGDFRLRSARKRRNTHISKTWELSLRRSFPASCVLAVTWHTEPEDRAGAEDYLDGWFAPLSKRAK
jgi:hypothetical protein